MAHLLKKMETRISDYKDRWFEGTVTEYEEALKLSTTVYVGNLSFSTREEQIYEIFSKCGDIKRIIMGLHQQSRTPCGFCFVVFYTREDTQDCVKYINGTTLDGRPIRVDFDWGFKEGRQYGRGKSGGQVRDEYRVEFDSGRGGYGEIVKQQLTSPGAQQGGGRNYQQHDMEERFERPPPAKRHRGGGGNNRGFREQQGGGGGGGGGAETRERNPRFREERDDSDHDD